MRLDKTLREEEIRFGCDPVDDALAPGWKRSDSHHRGIVGRDMHDDVFAIDDLLPVLVDQFLTRRRTVKAGGDENLYACVRLRGPNSTQQNRCNYFGRDGTGMI